MNTLRGKAFNPWRTTSQVHRISSVIRKDEPPIAERHDGWCERDLNVTCSIQYQTKLRIDDETWLNRKEKMLPVFMRLTAWSGKKLLFQIKFHKGVQQKALRLFKILNRNIVKGNAPGPDQIHGPFIGRVRHEFEEEENIISIGNHFRTEIVVRSAFDGRIQLLKLSEKINMASDKSDRVPAHQFRKSGQLIFT